MPAQQQELKMLQDRINALQDDLQFIAQRYLDIERDIQYSNARVAYSEKKIKTIEYKFSRLFFAAKEDPMFGYAAKKLVEFSKRFSQELSKKAQDNNYQPKYAEFLDCQPILRLESVAKPLAATDKFKEIGLDDKYQLGSFCLAVNQIDFIVKQAKRNIKPSFAKRLTYNVTDLFARPFGLKGLFHKENRPYINYCNYHDHVEALKSTTEYKVFYQYGQHKQFNSQIDKLYSDKVALLQQEKHLHEEIKALEAKKTLSAIKPPLGVQTVFPSSANNLTNEDVPHLTA
jgi:hypothetical protein